MPTITEGDYNGDLLIHEEGSLQSREEIVMTSGAGVVAKHTVLGKITASGEYTTHDPAAADGSETVAAISLAEVDATSAAVSLAGLLRRARVRRAALVYHSSITTEADRDTVAAGLDALGIVAMKDA